MTDARLKQILAYLYGGNGDVRWVAHDPATYTAVCRPDWLPVSDAEFFEMSDLKFAILNRNHGCLVTSAQGRTKWQSLGSPKPGDV